MESFLAKAKISPSNTYEGVVLAAEKFLAAFNAGQWPSGCT
jgi:hypothetical protein